MEELGADYHDAENDAKFQRIAAHFLLQRGMFSAVFLACHAVVSVGTPPV